MKNFVCKVAAVAVCAAAFCSSAFAKTEGGSVGISLHRASVEHNYYDGVNGVSANYVPTFGSSKTGVGVDYKYAINFGNNVFVAPGVFYERIGTKTNDTGANSATDTVSINNRYGAKLDIGYDLKDDLAVYFTNGMAHTDYKTSFNASGSTSGGETSYFYGVGLSTVLNANYSLGVEYNTQKVKFRSGVNSTQNVATQLDLYKLVLSYKF